VGPVANVAGATRFQRRGAAIGTALKAGRYNGYRERGNDCY